MKFLPKFTKFFLPLALGLAFLLPSCTSPIPPPVTLAKPHRKPVKVSSTHQSTGRSSRVSLEELFALQQSGKVLIYDVRVPYFYQIDHLVGAINWPHTEYAAQVQARDLEIQHALNSGKQVVFYCFNFGCAEARNVAHKLAQRDYKIAVFSAGIDAWRAAGLPLE